LLSVLKPDVHLSIVKHDGKALEDELRFFSFLETEAVDGNSLYVFRREEAVEDMSVSATLNSHHVFVVVEIRDIVTTFSFVLKGEVLPCLSIEKDSVHFECDAIAFSKRDSATEFSLVDFILGEIISVGLKVFDEHVEETSWGFGSEDGISLFREGKAILVVEDL